MELIVAITGATGSVFGVRLLERLGKFPDVTTHLVMSKWARPTIEIETDWTWREVCDLADVVHSINDQAASISSGSYPIDGMAIVPCSMKTLAAIRHGFGDGLIARAADVTLKERRRLVVVPRETPLSTIHLENMLGLAQAGASIVPPMPSFYHRPQSVEELVDDTVSRILDHLGVPDPNARRWNGPPGRSRHTPAALLKSS